MPSPGRYFTGDELYPDDGQAEGHCLSIRFAPGNAVVNSTRASSRMVASLDRKRLEADLLGRSVASESVVRCLHLKPQACTWRSNRTRVSIIRCSERMVGQPQVIQKWLLTNRRGARGRSHAREQQAAIAVARAKRCAMRKQHPRRHGTQSRIRSGRAIHGTPQRPNCRGTGAPLDIRRLLPRLPDRS